MIRARTDDAGRLRTSTHDLVTQLGSQILRQPFGRLGKVVLEHVQVGFIGLLRCPRIADDQGSGELFT